MKASELRIGNLALIDGEQTIIKGWMIHLMQIGETSGKKIEPIPLTEEWLVRLGFEKVNSTWYAHRLSKFRLNVAFDVEWINHWMGIRIQHVHQLQNLYFALTGEELKYD